MSEVKTPIDLFQQEMGENKLTGKEWQGQNRMASAG